MKVLLTVIYTVFLFIVFLDCYGDINWISGSTSISIYGSWLNKQFFPGWNDTLVTIYSFLSNNKFSITIFDTNQTQSADTSFYGGTYSIPQANLIFLYYEYYRRGDNFLQLRNFRDTIIFQITDNYLNLWNNGRSYRQLSGQIHQLLNGKFYDVKKFGTNFSYDLYYFTSDTLHYYSTTSEITHLPGVWLNHTKHKYINLDCYIDVDMGYYVNRIGYVFYKTKLILAFGPRTYNKLL